MSFDMPWIKAGILYMKPKLLTTIIHNTILNLGFDWGVFFFNTPKARIVN